MHPYVIQAIAATRQLELLEEARRSRLAEAARRPAPGPDVTVRFARDTDALALDRLAILSERPMPQGTVLVASVRGEVIAAAAVEGGQAIYDPFRRTADAVSQICRQAKSLRGPFPWLRVPVRRLRAAF
ncbi:MAG: hypothetical protein ABI948_05180 [Thermoleophilia bacterium]